MSVNIYNKTLFSLSEIDQQCLLYYTYYINTPRKYNSEKYS